VETYWPAVKENGEAIHSFKREREREREREGPGNPRKKREKSAKQELVLWLSSTDLWACWAPTWERLLDCVFPCFLSPRSLSLSLSLSFSHGCLPLTRSSISLACIANPIYVKHQAKFVMNQTYVDHEAYEREGFLSLVLNSGRGLTPISRHNLPPIPSHP